MSKKPEKRAAIQFRNKSPYGWWVASYLMRFEYYDEDGADLDWRCLAWANTIIVKAKGREEAYRRR